MPRLHQSNFPLSASGTNGTAVTKGESARSLEKYVREYESKYFTKDAEEGKIDGKREKSVRFAGWSDVRGGNSWR